MLTPNDFDSLGILADRLERFLGVAVVAAFERLMGLILAALAVEVMSDGLVKLFPALAR